MAHVRHGGSALSTPLTKKIIGVLSAAMGTYNMRLVKAEAKRRRARILKLFQAGKRVQDIADMLEITRQRASYLLAKARKDA